MTQVVRQGLLGWLAVAATAGVSLAQTLPGVPSAAAAKVTTLTGQVSVLRDSYPWALQAGDSVELQQVIITGEDGYAQLRVSDGSTFEVFPNSRVSFRNNPGSMRDLLDLWIGRVKIHIQKWGGQPNPNRIHTPSAVISVRGTTFDVAVEEDDSTLVAVEEGQVAVQHRLIGHSEPKLVNAGEQLRVYKDSPLASRPLDKGALLERGMRALADVFYSILLRGGPRGLPGGRIPGGIPGGPPLPGDTGGTPPAGPPPPPPPP